MLNQHGHQLRPSRKTITQSVCHEMADPNGQGITDQEIDQPYLNVLDDDEHDRSVRVSVRYGMQYSQVLHAQGSLQTQDSREDLVSEKNSRGGGVVIGSFLHSSDVVPCAGKLGSRFKGESSRIINTAPNLVLRHTEAGL